MILLLTGCIDPKGMAYTALNNPDVRKQQYVDAITWYLQNTELPVLFVENSGTDISSEFISYIEEGKLEMITYDGNNYDKSLGKGYGEAQIMKYGFEHSRFLQERGALVVKITGRFICKNINDIVRRYHSENTVYADICKDDWGGNIASSIFVIAPSQFWKEYFLPRREELNDSKRFHFEHLLYESICQWFKDGKKHREFWRNPLMIGVSGTSGLPSISSECRDFKNKMLYLLHRIGYRGYLNPFYKGNPDFVING